MNTISDDVKMKWAELLWSEYKYRHEVYWKSLYLWGGGAIAIQIAPFLKPELRTLVEAIFIFPVLGLIISLIGAWHLSAESERLGAVGRKYDELRGDEYLPERLYRNDKRTWYQQAAMEPLGKAVTFLFTFGLTSFTFVTTSFLFILLYPTKWKIPLIIGISVVCITGITLFVIVNKRKEKYNKTFFA
jgi:hypothetical protein